MTPGSGTKGNNHDHDRTSPPEGVGGYPHRLQRVHDLRHRLSAAHDHHRRCGDEGGAARQSDVGQEHLLQGHGSAADPQSPGAAAGAAQAGRRTGLGSVGGDLLRAGHRRNRRASAGGNRYPRCRIVRRFDLGLEHPDHPRPGPPLYEPGRLAQLDVGCFALCWQHSRGESAHLRLVHHAGLRQHELFCAARSQPAQALVDAGVQLV